MLYYSYFEWEIAVLILTDDRGTEDIKLTKNREISQLPDRLTCEIFCLVADIVNISSCQRHKKFCKQFAKQIVLTS